MTRRAHLSSHGDGTSRRRAGRPASQPPTRGSPGPSGSGVLVVRAWFDGDELRARVMSTTDVTAPDETVLLAVGQDGVLAAVRAWLEGMEGARP